MRDAGGVPFDHLVAASGPLRDRPPGGWLTADMAGETQVGAAIPGSVVQPGCQTVQQIHA